MALLERLRIPSLLGFIILTVIPNQWKWMRNSLANPCETGVNSSKAVANHALSNEDRIRLDKLVEKEVQIG